MALGFDPDDGKNVTLIPYPDIVTRLAPHPALPLASLDAGVRACIEAQAGCRAYVFHFEQQDRKRQGGFWSDFLNIRRVTKVTDDEAEVEIAQGVKVRVIKSTITSVLTKNAKPAND